MNDLGANDAAEVRRGMEKARNSTVSGDRSESKKANIFRFHFRGGGNHSVWPRGTKICQFGIDKMVLNVSSNAPLKMFDHFSTTFTKV